MAKRPKRLWPVVRTRRDTVGFPVPGRVLVTVLVTVLVQTALLVGALMVPPAYAQDNWAEEPRVALVIGNGAYEAELHGIAVEPLPIPPNDAMDLGAALERLGFDVTTVIDGNKATIEAALRDFREKLYDADVGLLYYSGHGLEVDGRNYLLPVDLNVQQKEDLDIEAVALDLVIAQMSAAAPRLSLLILDACRNNPYSQILRRSATVRNRSVDVGRGLARVDAPAGMMIAYATAPGTYSYEPTGAGAQNGIYTAALLDNIDEPGLTVEQVFKRVRTTVMQDTADFAEGQQVPWEESSLTGDFYFASAPDLPPVNREAIDLAFWTSIDGSDDPADYWAYLERFPSGAFSDLARNRLDRLQQEQPGPGDPGTDDGVNRPPQVSPDLEIVAFVGMGPVSLELSEPTDPDGDELIVVVDELPGGGQTQVGDFSLRTGQTLGDPDALTRITFDPQPLAEGETSDVTALRYTVDDQRGGTAQGTVAIERRVHDCDLMAGFPNDPEGVADGVPAVLVDPSQAITACSDAAARFPDVPRVQAQLGRAFLKAQDFADALRWVRASSEEGYAPGPKYAGCDVHERARRGAERGRGCAVVSGRSGPRLCRGPKQSGLAVPQRHRRCAGLRRGRALVPAGCRPGRSMGADEPGRDVSQRFRRRPGRRPGRRVVRESRGRRPCWAQNNLGTMYLRGIGVPQDLPQAVRWFARAADGVAPDAGEAARENLELLTPEDRVRAAQVMLADADYDAGRSDGVMGAQTRRAIQEFRRDHGLPDGADVTLDLLLALGRVE